MAAEAGDWRAPARAGEAAVALLSGGLDSGVAMAAWLDAGGRCLLALTADYGQRAAAAEAAAAARLAARARVPWRSLALPWLGELCRQQRCALAGGGAALPHTTPEAPGDAATAKAVWVPARNVVLVAAAAAFAETLGAGGILAGFNAEEAETFADNSPAFVVAFDALLVHGCWLPVRLLSPTLALDKRAIVAQARRLGLSPDDFWSCYDGGPSRCGRCESCVRATRAWGAA